MFLKACSNMLVEREKAARDFTVATNSNPRRRRDARLCSSARNATLEAVEGQTRVETDANCKYYQRQEGFSSPKKGAEAPKLR